MPRLRPLSVLDRARTMLPPADRPAFAPKGTSPARPGELPILLHRRASDELPVDVRELAEDGRALVVAVPLRPNIDR